MEIEMNHHENMREKRIDRLLVNRGRETSLVCYTCGMEHTSMKEVSECCSCLD